MLVKIRLPPGIVWIEGAPLPDRRVGWLVNLTTGRIFAHRVEVSELAFLGMHRRDVAAFLEGQVLAFGRLLMRNE
ncbi:MAG TPA: hypothetical protein VI589_06900, partial [Vicinamibacteria bacterium]